MEIVFDVIKRGGDYLLVLREEEDFRGLEVDEDGMACLEGVLIGRGCFAFALEVTTAD